MKDVLIYGELIYYICAIIGIIISVYTYRRNIDNGNRKWLLKNQKKIKHIITVLGDKNSNIRGSDVENNSEHQAGIGGKAPKRTSILSYLNKLCKFTENIDLILESISFSMYCNLRGIELIVDDSINQFTSFSTNEILENMSIVYKINIYNATFHYGIPMICGDNKIILPNEELFQTISNDFISLKNELNDL